MSINNSCRAFVVYGAICVILYIFFQHGKKTTSVESLFSNISKTNSLFSNISKTNLLFGDYSKIRQCTVGKIIGIRPSVTTISVKKVAYYKKPEDSQERKTAFRVIFQNRIWRGSEKTANISASGKTIT